MTKLSRNILLIFSVLVLFASIVFAEDITITTYYPSPYGSYNQLTTQSNTYLATTSGTVGIGTTVPAAKLDVFASGTSTYQQSIRNTAGNAGLRFNINNGDWAIGMDYNTGKFNIAFGTNLSLNPTLVVDWNGRVGIGTEVPGYKLHVAGDIYATGVVISSTNPSVVQTCSGTSCAAPCSSGYWVSGGGIELGAGASRVIASKPSGNGWYCGADAGSMTCYAVCRK